ncbi:MAG: ketopantoate reductase family protein [Acutalibacteraceae bacterium]
MIEKISLIGLGAMGSFFAPRLWETYKDNFRVIASGERKKRLTEKGVTLNGVNYKFNCITPENKDKADLIIIATKGYSLKSAIEDIRNQVGENTIIMSVMNGVNSEEELIKEFGADKVIYSFMRVSIVMKDGVANFDPKWGHVHFGDKKNDLSSLSKPVKAVKECFEKANIQYIIEPDMEKGMYFKFMCNIGENMTCALLGVPFGAFRFDRDANFIRKKAMLEVMNIARKKGINLTEKDMEKQEETLMSIPSENKPSTLQDLESKKDTEIELFAGSVVKMGKELGVETPVNELFYHAIKVFEKKNKGVYSEIL